MSEIVAKLNKDEIKTFKKYYKSSDNYHIADFNWSEKSRELAKKFLETNWGNKLIIKSVMVEDPEKQIIKLKFLMRGASYYTDDNKNADMTLMYLDAPGLFRFIKNTFQRGSFNI